MFILNIDVLTQGDLSFDCPFPFLARMSIKIYTTIDYFFMIYAIGELTQAGQPNLESLSWYWPRKSNCFGRACMAGDIQKCYC